MKSLIVAAALFAPAIALACEGDNHAAAPKSLSVPEVAQLTQAKKAVVLDANNPETRSKLGVVPGALMLTSASEYSVKELPAAKDSKLVFYCAATKCSASHTAAERALQAGYTDVNVMPDGIAGWKKAGQKTESIKPKS